MTEPGRRADEAAPRVGQGRRPAVKRPWPRLPVWFWAGATVALVGFVSVGVVAIVKLATFEEQPIYERRSAPMAAEQSHHVGRVVLPEGVPVVDAECGAIRGLRVQGGPDTAPLLADAVRGLCRRLPAFGDLGVQLGERMKRVAEARPIISFANFGRTGELTTTLPGTPPRILLSDAFLRGGGRFKGFLLPELAHELWHAGTAGVTAEEELLARKVELAACAEIPSSDAFRGCTDAKRIVEAGDEAALAGLRAAGFG